MKVKLTQLRELFQAVGYGNASKWDANKMAEKVGDMAELIDKDSAAGIENEELQTLYKKLKKAMKNEDEIEIIEGKETAKKSKAKAKDEDADDDDEDEDEDESDDEDEDEDEDEDADDDDEDEDDEEEEEDDEDDDEDEDEKPAKKKGKKSKKAAKDDEEDEDDDEEEDDDEDEKPAKKKKKAKKDKKSAKKGRAGGKGGGVIGYITEQLKKAGERGKLLKESKLEEMLEKKFPDRDIEGMMVTFRSQVPKRFFDVRQIYVEGSRKKGWMIVGEGKIPKGMKEWKPKSKKED